MAHSFPIIGAAIAIAGSDKLAGYSYNRMFRHLDWSPAAAQAAAYAETAGVSAALLLSEMNHRDTKLALPRALVLLSGLAALFVPARPAR